MEQIIITKPDGSKVPMQSKRMVTAIKSAKQTRELLGSDVVNISVESPYKQEYGIGDTITVFGSVYKMNRLPVVKKLGTHQFSYELEYEEIQYDLLRATYDLTIDTTNNQLQDVQADTLTGSLNRFATVLIANANRVFPGMWVLGDCPETISDKTLTFGENDSCLTVLQNLCSEFSVEFGIVQADGVFTLHFLEKVGQQFPFTFQFGKGKGLYELNRQNVDSSNIVTRLKVYGSTSNITHKYRASRLCLPGCSKGQSYIEKPDAVAKYGIFEATKYFDDVKPTFNGKITAIVQGNVLQFVDSNMFDLNEADDNGTKYLLNGVSAKIHFNTGNLAGYEFDVHSYDHAAHTFTLVKITDERDDVFPSEDSPAFQFAAGDEYKILDVALPPEYEEAAENALAAAGEAYYDQNCQPKVQYGLSVDKMYLPRLAGNGNIVNIFAPGDYLPIKDDDIGVDKSVRIKSFVRNLLDEYEYTLTISDTVTKSITSRVISELTDLDKIATINNLKDPARARANWRSSREVLNMVFDPDGDYYTDKIKPSSIDTLALSVGAKSTQFGLTNTVFQANYNANKNVIAVKGGVLTHYTINEDGVRSWSLADNTTTFDSDAAAYYIYAKCERVGDAGTIIFSTEQIKVEQDVSYYHFWVGVVNSVDDTLQARAVSLSYGFTTVNGGFLTTGRVKSADEKTYFDLDKGEIGGNIRFYAGEQNGVSQYSEALKGSTDVLGGLTLGNLMLVKDLLGNIRGGMSGLSSDPVALFAHDEDAYNVAVKYLLGQSTVKPNFAVSKLGELLANKGFIGNAEIIDGDLVLYGNNSTTVVTRESVDDYELRNKFLLKSSESKAYLAWSSFPLTQSGSSLDYTDNPGGDIPVLISSLRPPGNVEYRARTNLRLVLIYSGISGDFSASGACFPILSFSSSYRTVTSYDGKTMYLPNGTTFTPTGGGTMAFPAKSFSWNRVDDVLTGTVDFDISEMYHDGQSNPNEPTFIPPYNYYTWIKFDFGSGIKLTYSISGQSVYKEQPYIEQTGTNPLVRLQPVMSENYICSDGILIKSKNGDEFLVKNSTDKLSIRAALPLSADAAIGELYNANGVVMIKQ